MPRCRKAAGQEKGSEGGRAARNEKGGVRRVGIGDQRSRRDRAHGARLLDRMGVETGQRRSWRKKTPGP